MNLKCRMCGGTGRTTVSCSIHADGTFETTRGGCPACMGSGHALGWVGAERDRLRAEVERLKVRVAELERMATTEPRP